MKSDRPLARPGCLWVPGSSTVSVCNEQGGWRQVPMQHCGICRTEQHLRVCLDCGLATGEYSGCGNCGSKLPKGKRRYCSQECRTQVLNQRKNHKQQAQRLVSRARVKRSCGYCAGDIPPERNLKARYCKDMCRHRAKWERQNAQVASQRKEARRAEGN